MRVKDGQITESHMECGDLSPLSRRREFRAIQIKMDGSILNPKQSRSCAANVLYSATRRPGVTTSRFDPRTLIWPQRRGDTEKTFSVVSAPLWLTN